MIIREATQADMPEVGDIRLAAYQAGGFISADSGYASTLHGLGADGKGHVLVAVLPDQDPCKAGSRSRSGSRPGSTQGRITGTIMLQTWPTLAAVQGPDEAGDSSAAVRPHAQGQGVGAGLLRRLIDLAAGKGQAAGVAHRGANARLTACTSGPIRAAARAGLVTGARHYAARLPCSWKAARLNMTAANRGLRGCGFGRGSPAAGRHRPHRRRPPLARPPRPPRGRPC